jgi:hypothetical protein
MDRKRDKYEDEQLLVMLKQISAKGHNAEVKQNRDGTWVVYEVKKEKRMVR